MSDIEVMSILILVLLHEVLETAEFTVT